MTRLCHSYFNQETVGQKQWETESERLCHMNYYEQQKQQTRQFIFKAFFELMEIRPFRHITVSELCERAQIGRKTFYRHFSSVQMVLDEYFAALCLEYIAGTKPLQEYQFETICYDFFSFWQQHQTELRLIQSSLGFGYITSQVLKNASTVIEHRSGAKAPGFALYSTGGLCGLLECWVSKENPVPADIFSRAVCAEIEKVHNTRNV